MGSAHDAAMHWAKRALRRILPVKVRDFIWYCRSRDLRQALAAARMIRKRLGSSVLTGPFAGMNYIVGSGGSDYPPKLLGPYEQERWPVIEEIVRQDYRLVIDIGAGEGYYAVVLAKRLPQAGVIAFEAQTQ